MSTRWYRIYQKGDPQRRIFLPNFWMKLVQPEGRQPGNIVTFHCSMEMTRQDIANYLSKIYNVQAMNVRTRIDMGRFKIERGRVNEKLPDTKIAYVTLEENETFEFPEVVKIQEVALKEKEDRVSTDELEGNMDMPKDLAPGEIPWFDTYCIPLRKNTKKE